MHTIYVVLLTILSTIVVYEGVRRLIRAIKNQVSRFVSLEKRLEFHDTTITNHGTRLHNNEIDLRDSDKQINELEKKFRDIETVANNFDRDMNKYHKNVDKEFKSLLNKESKKLTERLDVAFTRINAHSERMAAIERRQKEYDTSLMTQAKMIGDLQKEAKK